MRQRLYPTAYASHNYRAKVLSFSQKNRFFTSLLYKLWIKKVFFKFVLEKKEGRKSILLRPFPTFLRFLAYVRVS